MDTPIMLGLDYAVRHTEAQLKEAMRQGIRFVVRYLAPPYLHQAKSILRDEADMLRSLGLGAVSVYQRRNTEIADFDLEHAKLDANWAVENAVLAGQDKGVIYFAMDFDVQPAQLLALQEYLDEVARLLKATPYEVGVYGSHLVVAELDAPHKWQTYAWSRGYVSRKAKMLQCHNGVGIAGGSNDLNVAWGDPGCWLLPKTVAKPDMPMLKQGDKSWQVSVLQSLLARQNHHTNGIDGVFGPGTERAAKDYQRSKGLEADGIAGPATWGVLWPVVIADDEIDPRDEQIAHLAEKVRTLEAINKVLLENMEKIRQALSVLRSV